MKERKLIQIFMQIKTVVPQPSDVAGSNEVEGTVTKRGGELKYIFFNRIDLLWLHTAQNLAISESLII